MSSKAIVFATLFLVALALFISFKFFVHNAYKAFPSGPSMEAELPPRFEWKEYTAPNGKFQVKLPLVPQQASESLTDPLTKQTRLYDMFIAQELDGTIYMVSTITFKDKMETQSPKDLLKKIVSDMVKANPDNQLLTTKSSTFKNLPAQDFTIKNPQMTIEGKSFLDEQTLYILTTMENNQNYKPEDFSYFLKSFELMK